MTSLFITGITSGIGSVILHLAVSKKWNITAVIRSQKQKSELQKKYPTVTFLIAELSNRKQVDSLAKNLKTNFDYVVLNAGYADVGKFHELSVSSYENMIETNLLTNMRFAHTFLSGKAKIIFTSSIVARLPGKKYATYAVSKAALSQFYASLAVAYPHKQFLCIELGGVATPFHKKTKFGVSSMWLKDQELIGKRMFKAIQHKTGVTTLALDWNIARKILMVFEDTILKMMK
jgi:short-subunit dehydrogenase